jgi:hypothetical protein
METFDPMQRDDDFDRPAHAWLRTAGLPVVAGLVVVVVIALVLWIL